jgi:EamA domain-containing membrane protein RarD
LLAICHRQRSLSIEAFANRLAARFDSAIMLIVAGVLQQFWHVREGTPFSIDGNGTFSVYVGSTKYLYLNSQVQRDTNKS